MNITKFIFDVETVVTAYPSLKTVFYSVVLSLLFVVIKLVVSKQIRRRGENNSYKSLLVKRSSSYLNYLLFTLLIFLWFSQLQTVFVSLFAVAAAIVIAFKELIMCITGGILIRKSRMLKVGHRIEVDGVRGFVIESHFLTTKILEIGPERSSQQTTGDIITIPNSLMLSKALKNESYFQGYTVKSFSFRVENIKTYKLLEAELLNYAQEICKSYSKEAENIIHSFCDADNIKIPSTNPRTKISLNEDGILFIIVKIPVRADNIGDIEQKLSRFFLQQVIHSNSEVLDS